MKLFTKFYEMVELLKSIDNTLKEIRDFVNNNNIKLFGTNLNKSEKMFKKTKSSDFIPDISTNKFKIKSTQNVVKRGGKNYDVIADKMDDD